MVAGLPEIHIPGEICEDFVQSKHHRGNFHSKCYKQDMVHTKSSLF